jgi:hypothetical protein
MNSVRTVRPVGNLVARTSSVIISVELRPEKLWPVNRGIAVICGTRHRNTPKMRGQTNARRRRIIAGNQVCDCLTLFTPMAENALSAGSGLDTLLADKCVCRSLMTVGLTEAAGVKGSTEERPRPPRPARAAPTLREEVGRKARGVRKKES